MKKEKEDKLLTRAEAAQRLGKKAGTLAVWATKRPTPLPYHKIGGTPLYKESDVQAFIESGRVE